MTTRSQLMGRDLRHNKGDFESSSGGDVSRISGLDNLDQALYHRLITTKGTLTHRPNYGVGIKGYQGQIANIDTQRSLAIDIDNQFRMDQRVESVDQVRFVTSDEEPDKFLVFVKYSAIGYNDIESTFDPFELGV